LKKKNLLKGEIPAQKGMGPDEGKKKKNTPQEVGRIRIQKATGESKVLGVGPPETMKEKSKPWGPKNKKARN